MKDIEKLKELLNGWGVPFKEEPSKDGGITISVGNEMFPINDHPKITGYMGFMTIFEFSSEGEFIKMGAWE